MAKRTSRKTSKKKSASKASKTSGTRKKAARKKTSSRGASRKKSPSRRKTTRKKATPRRTSDEPVLIYIHGIGDHPPKEEMKHLWDLALFGSDMGDRTRMAYWSDILHGDPKKKKNIGAKRWNRDLEAETLLREAKLDAKDESAVQFAEALAAAVSKTGTSRGGVRAKVLPLPGFLRRPVARKFLSWFVKDTAAYFFSEENRRKIKQRLIEQLPPDGQPFVLVSHSQGTIVSFEVLSELGKQADAELFVTLGSPLGIREVQDLIEDAGHKLKVPSGVQGWRNFADRLDPVAADSSLAGDFEPYGMVKVRDQRVVNERTKDLQRFNPHSSEGYLSHPAVRKVIHHAWGFDSAGRFIVARDVAEEFVGTGRQPVLIEALYPGYHAIGEDPEVDTPKREARQPEEERTLPGRIGSLKKQVQRLVREGGNDDEEARVMALRKYVAAHLTPVEIRQLAEQHRELNVYAVWRSSNKQKLLWRSHRAIKADAARTSYGAQGAGVTWAVLDTGARWDHPHLEDVVEAVYDCTKPGDHPIPMYLKGRARNVNVPGDECDLDGHGTHVAGIIAGEGTDGRGPKLGVAPRAKLVVYKVLDDGGFGEDAWIIKAIDHIYRTNDAGTGMHIHGVNLSLGGSFDATVYGCGYSPICQELRDLWRQGVMVCVAAGNEGQLQVLTDDGEIDLNTQLSVGDPANLEDCVAVGSVNADRPHMYGVSFFSSRGPTADGRAKPDLVAPGERILSCNSGFRGKNDLYRNDSGTSMACPHVSGLIAAFLSVRREFRGRPDEVKKILLANCNDLSRDRYHQGAGMPNLMKMLLNT